MYTVSAVAVFAFSTELYIFYGGKKLKESGEKLKLLTLIKQMFVSAE